MADAFNFYLGSRIMLGNEEASPLPLRQQIRSRQEIAGDGLCVASAEAAARDEVVVRGEHLNAEKRNPSVHRAGARTAGIATTSARTRR